jgi:hypothetical protein
MSPPLEALYDLRQLLARCRSSAGVEIADIEAIGALEHQLASPAADLAIATRVRTIKDDDPATIVSIDATTIVVTAAPYLEVGAGVELVIDDETSGRTYRFKGRVELLVDAEDDRFRATISLVGAPLLLRRRPRTAELEVAA